MSNSSYGMQTAARSYYSKVKDLSLQSGSAGRYQAPINSLYATSRAATNRVIWCFVVHDLKYITDGGMNDQKHTTITDGLQSLKASTSYPAYMDNYIKEAIEQD